MKVFTGITKLAGDGEGGLHKGGLHETATANGYFFRGHTRAPGTGIYLHRTDRTVG